MSRFPARRSFLPVGAFLLLGLVPPLVAQDAVLDGAAPLPTDSAVIIGRLDNGLTYYIRENARPEARAELRLALNAGSVLEDDDQRGLAHFVEHMAFNGTEHFAKQELVDYLESIGMQFGPSINAFTGFDETVYQLQVPTDDPETLATAFRILQDWAQGLSFDPEEVDKERGVVIEEWRLGRGAGARMLDQQLPVLFAGSRYAERLPIGTLETLQTFEHETLVRFYEDWYRPDLMAVVAVGDFDARELEAMIRSTFSGLTMPANVRARESVEVPSQSSTRFAIATDAEATQSQVAVTYALPVSQGRTVGEYRAQLIEQLYNGMLNRRFFEITQSPGAPFLFGGSGKGRFVRSLEIYQLVAGVADGGVERGLEALLVEGSRVAEHGFTEGEFERQKTSILRGLQQAFDDREKRESRGFASSYAFSYLQEDPPVAISTLLDLTEALLPTIELPEVNALARQWLSRPGRVVLVNAPAKPDVPVPTETALLGAFAAAAETPVEAYVDEGADQPLLAVLPEPGSVVSEATFPEVGITEWSLSNGARVLLKPTDFKDDQVLLRAFSPGGASLQSDAQYEATWLAATVVTQGGAGEFDLVQLQKKLSGKIVRVIPYISDREEGFQGEASPKDLETLFQLTHLYATAPRRDADALAALRQQMGGFLANRNANPMAVFMDTVSVTLTQHHPRSKPLSVERLDDVDLDASLDFYRERFADIGDFTFVLVGNLTLEGIRPYVERYLASLPNLGREEEARDNGIRFPAGVIEKVVERGIEPQSQTRIVFAGPAEYTREAASTLGAMGNALEIRLRERLREDLGGTYSVSVSGSISRPPGSEYQVTIAFGSAPDRVEELTAVIFEEIEILKGQGPPDDDVGKVKEAARRTKETSLRENAYWASQIGTFDKEGRDFGEIPSFELIESWSRDSMQEAARGSLLLDRYVRLTLMPEKAAS